MMSREIKFRGKRIVNGEWVCGDYCDCRKLDNTVQIRCWVGDYYASYDVVPKTVGQFTGRRDKDGKELCDGDLCKYGSKVLEVFWSTIGTGSWWFRNMLGENVRRIDLDDLVVIGNKWDNSELLVK